MGVNGARTARGRQARVRSRTPLAPWARCPSSVREPSRGVRDDARRTARRHSAPPHRVCFIDDVLRERRRSIAGFFGRTRTLSPSSSVLSLIPRVSRIRVGVVTCLLHVRTPHRSRCSRTEEWVVARVFLRIGVWNSCERGLLILRSIRNHHTASRDRHRKHRCRCMGGTSLVAPLAGV